MATIVDKADIPDLLPVLPLRSAVFFPGGVLPLSVGREKTIRMLKDVMKTKALLVAVFSQRQEATEDPKLEDLYQVGTLARVVKVLKMGETKFSVVVQGLARLRLVALASTEPYHTAKVEEAEPPQASESEDTRALGTKLKAVAAEIIALMPELPPAAAELVNSIEDPSQLADLVAANVDIPLEEKQSVLDTIEVAPRLQRVIQILEEKMALLRSAK